MAEESVVYVKVMTDEQMEVLRHQISVYATICDQLVELHKSITAHQDSISGSLLFVSSFFFGGGMVFNLCGVIKNGFFSFLGVWVGECAMFELEVIG